MNGLVVKERDDLLSATRTALMMLRKAAAPDDATRGPRMADGDYDPFSGAPSGRARGETREENGYDPLR